MSGSPDHSSGRDRAIVIASRNPVKAAATLGAFEKTFPDLGFRLETVSVPSGVEDQPSTDEETLRGASQRAANAVRAVPDGDYWVGLEGGIEDGPEGMTAFAWVVVRSRGQTGHSRSASFQLPEEIARLVRRGIELGEADDMVFGRSNSKQKDGAVGILTDNLIDRTALYEPAVILALIPFRHPDLYG